MNHERRKEEGAKTQSAPLLDVLAPSLGKPKRRASEPPTDVDAQVWADWLALRKAKRAPVTDTVVKSARAEAEKAAISLSDFLALWCARGSQGLRAEWLKADETRAQRGAPSETAYQRSMREKVARMSGGLLGKKPSVDVETVEVFHAPAPRG